MGFRPADLRVEVWGRAPAPAGSFRAILVHGQARLVPGGSNEGLKAAKAWRKLVTELVRDMAAQVSFDACDGDPVRVRLVFGMPRTKSVPKWRRWPRSAPDIDKLARCTLDAVTDAGVWNTDGQVVELRCRKEFADPAGATIEVWKIGDEERAAAEVARRGERLPWTDS